MLYCSERANTHIEHGAKGAYREIFPVLLDFPFSVKDQIVLFATSGGSGFGNTVKELQPSAPGAEIVEGKLLNRANKQEIENWVKEL